MSIKTSLGIGCPPCTIYRKFPAVGHGAFYIERFYSQDDPGNCFMTTVYDCGGMDIVKRINEEFVAGETIHALFISHLHHDHIGGIVRLCKKCKVERIFLPVITPEMLVEAVLYNYITTRQMNCAANNFAIEMYDTESGHNNSSNSNDNKIQIICLQSGEHNIFENNSFWKYCIYNPTYEGCPELLSEFTEIEKNALTGDLLLQAISKKSLQECKDIYRRHFPNGHNAYSMAVYSGCVASDKYIHADGLLNMLYLGDYECKEKYADLQEHFKDVWANIQVVQVPHHGSINNHNINLYTYLSHQYGGQVSHPWCVISANGRYNLPSADVAKEIIGTGCSLSQITNSKETARIYTDVFWASRTELSRLHFK